MINPSKEIMKVKEALQKLQASIEELTKIVKEQKEIKVNLSAEDIKASKRNK